MMTTMTEHICLGRFYPREGVPGVLALPVFDPEDIDVYREVAAIRKTDDVHFFRLTTIPKESCDWLLPGDVVCQYQELDEAMMDLVRPNATSALILWDRHDRLDDKALENARDKAIENHRWIFERSDMQLTIVDPFGRAAALVVSPGRLTRLFKSFSSIVPKTDYEKLRHSKLSPEMLCAGHFVMRTLHREMIKHELGVSTEVYLKFRKAVQALYDQRFRCAKYEPEEEMLRIHFSSWRGKRQRCRAFMDYCKAIYASDQAALPRPLRLMASKHYHVKWVRLSPREWEECLLFW